MPGCSAIGDAAQQQRGLSIRPQYALDWSQGCCDVQQCAEEVYIGSHGPSLAAIVSGCGQDAADIALAACRHLAEALQVDRLTPDDLVSAFEQCHARLLQQAAQQLQGPDTQHQQQQRQQLNVSHSGASCLLVVVDPTAKQLLAASAGLCHAVMARTAPGGALTVLELSPRLALGYNVAETSRMDAEGSRICYSCRTLSQPAPTPQQPTAAAGGGQLQQQAVGVLQQPQPQLQLQHASCPEPVLIGPDGQPHAGVRASRLLGYSSASAAGVTATPVVTSWRLSGEEAFVVLGSPGLWAAMNPAEVVDYVAAALASGACSSSMQAAAEATAPPAEAAADADAAAADDSSILPPGQEQCQQEAAGAELRPDAAVLLSDLLTLEAQERLKLRLGDISTLLGGAAGAAGGGGSHQVVPDVTAVVLLLSGPLPPQKVPQDKALLQQELACVARGCRSNAEAQALQASWYSSAAASTCSSSPPSMVAASSSSSSSIAAASASMSSSADSTCSTSTSAISAACSSPDPKGSSRSQAGPAASAAAATPAGAVCYPVTAANLQAAAQAGAHTRRACPAAEPACPALSCLLPALTVAGHCWPSTFWPAASAAVSVPAALSRRSSSVSAAVAAVAAAAAAGEGADGASGSAAAAAPGQGPTRPVGFTLSPRLSIELDVTHRPGSVDSTSSLLAAQCAAADAAADAAAIGGLLPEQLPSPSPAEQQAVIVHKVRLSGPSELESLLFGSATTAYPDTTVARILKPKLSGSSSMGCVGAGHGTLEHAYSWTGVGGGLSSSGGGLGYSSISSGSTAARQQHRASGWAPGGGCSTGGWVRPLHVAPRRSASVNIAQLSRQLHGGGGASCSSSAASSQLSQASSLRGLAGSGSFGRGIGADSLAGAFPSGSAAAARVRSQRSSLEGIEERGAPGMAAGSSSGQQQQQPDRVSERGAQLSTHAQAPASLPAGAPAAGLVSKARSYQALSALQAAGSAERGNSLGAAAAPAALGATRGSAAAENREGPASADAGCGLRRSGSGGAGQLHFRPAFGSAAAPAFQQRLSDSTLLGLQQQQDAPEGKVHGGLSCSSRSSSMRALGSAEALGAGSPAGLLSLAAAAAPGAAAGTALGSGSLSQGEELCSQTESCMRGGHSKAARLKHSMSHPELNALAPGTTTRPRRSSAVLPPWAALSSSTAPTPDLSLDLQEKGARLGGSRGGSSLPAALASSSSLQAAGSASLSPFAQDSSLAVLQQQQPVTFRSACAGISGCGLSPAGSRELCEGSLGADGAVHGGELGEQALEGQMHGGRRSKSMSVSSLLLTSSVPSSAEDDDDTLTSSLSPGSKQLLPSRRTNRASNSYNSSLSCSSSLRQLPLSPAGSGALRYAGLASGRSSMDTAAAGPGAGALPIQGSGSLTSMPSLSHADMGSGGLQAFASANGPLELLLAAGSSCDAAGSNERGRVEVVRMPSGSFSKVRFAASAPAGALGCEQLSSVVDATTDCPPGVFAGVVQHSMAAGALLGGDGQALEAAAAWQGSSSSASFGGCPTAVRGWSSPGRQVVAFSSSAGSSDAALRNSSSSMPGCMTAGLGSPSQLPAMPKPGGWSSSRAWGSKPAARKLSTNVNLFARSGASPPRDLGPGSSAGEGAAGGVVGAQQMLQAARRSSDGTAGGSSSRQGEGGPSAAQRQEPDTYGQSDCADAGDAVLLAALPSTKRSGTLPTLQESPACTPVASPDVSFSFATAYEETLARHLGLRQLPQQPQQQQEPQDHQGLLVLGPDGPDDDACCGQDGAGGQPLHQQQPHAQQQQGSLPEHSATGLVLQSLTAEASRRSIDESSSCSRGTCTPTCSSEGCSGELRQVLASESFEFSRPHPGTEAAWEQSPLLGKNLQG